MSRVPTEPGWWWRCDNRSERWCTEVYLFGGEPHWTGGEVADDGCWLAPVASPEEVAELRAEVERLRKEAGHAHSIIGDVVLALAGCERPDPLALAVFGVVSERDEARAEVDRLRSLVATLERAAGGGGE